MRFGFFLVALIFAGDVYAGEITVRDAWSPPSLSQPNGVGFMTIENTGDNDILLSAASACCKAVELHTHAEQDGVLRMRRLQEVGISMGKTVSFAPRGLHLMLIGLKEPLVNGERFPITLTFRDAGARTVEFTVSEARLLEAIESPKAHSH